MQCRTSLLASLCWHINCLASNLQIIAQSCISRWKILHTSSKGWNVREQGGRGNGSYAAPGDGSSSRRPWCQFDGKRRQFQRQKRNNDKGRARAVNNAPNLCTPNTSSSLFPLSLPLRFTFPTRCCLLNCMTGSNWFQCGWERGRRGERKGCRRDTGYGLRCGSNSGSGAISVAFTLPLLRPLQFPMPATPSNF